ncbi:MAG: hypothetical protein JO123_11095 [Ktedonobacteraceae bacterium]|nr:hypothetical protein [Ktedonobacteraceae bacterium]
MTAQQIFFFGILVFAIIGLQRGWRRELISLVFAMIGAFLLIPGNGNTFQVFLDRLLGATGVLISGTQPPPPGPLPSWAALAAFAIVLGLGYYISTRAFPKPATPAERIIGVVPAIITGAIVLDYLFQYFTNVTGSPTVNLSLPTPDPTSFVPILFVIALVSVVVALITSRMRKTPAKK